MKRLENICWCPTQFQQYIPGNDYRIHVVGEEVFVCEITSHADDYRYASRQGVDVEIRSTSLPADILDRCRRLVKAMGLSVAGLDLRYGPDGEWYCLKVNPSPGFTYFQDATGQPIDKAISRLLVGVLAIK
jgi:glutathione synthase/RimK-type ligase-like ATP-grasp enzyme